MKPNVVTLAMTGASGAEYTLRLIEVLLRNHIQIQFISSQPGQIVMGMETELKLTGSPQKMRQTIVDYFSADPELIQVYSRDQWTAPLASGSAVPDAMVVCPCTTATVSAIANGASRSLIERAADVVIKERNKLVLVVRETPFSTIHLENMLRLAQAGAVVLPACPGFYHRPSTVDELVDFIVARVLDQLGIGHALLKPWGSEAGHD